MILIKYDDNKGIIEGKKAKLSRSCNNKSHKLNISAKNISIYLPSVALCPPATAASPRRKNPWGEGAVTQAIYVLDPCWKRIGSVLRCLSSNLSGAKSVFKIGKLLRTLVGISTIGLPDH